MLFLLKSFGHITHWVRKSNFLWTNFSRHFMCLGISVRACVCACAGVCGQQGMCMHVHACASTQACTCMHVHMCERARVHAHYAC